ncbi:hypothetical protein DSO57_1033171 [Entomophthora muscae]|uniref:Uncharacterized protein n=1 Tax=Entomophthora muscae TaxID=34485 RepID=A0ACC2UAJ6_9FUNG|nr:hypothetical protein DSO57_1033171 [Entomophthora muscae]
MAKRRSDIEAHTSYSSHSLEEVDTASGLALSSSDPSDDLQNKFRSLELKARSFETQVMQLVIVQTKERLNLLKPAGKFGFQAVARSQYESFYSSLNVSVVYPEKQLFIKKLVEFYLCHVNGLCLRLCDETLISQLDKDPFGSLLVKSACALAFPIVVRLNSNFSESLDRNPFYLSLKSHLTDCFQTPDITRLLALAACCYLEVGCGTFLPASLTIVKGKRLMHLVGIGKDEKFANVLNGDPELLTRSFLWNFWKNCIGLDDKDGFEADSQFKHENFSLGCFERIRFSVDNSDPTHELVKVQVFNIFNLQMYRYITALQRKVSKDSKDVPESFSKGIKILTCLTHSDIIVEAWVYHFMTSRIYNGEGFFLKATHVLNHFSNHLLVLNLINSCKTLMPSNVDQHAIPNFRDTCEKILDTFKAFENHTTRHLPFRDINYLYTVCFTNTLPYYYMCLLCLEDHSSRGSRIFYLCLNKLRTLSSIWPVLNTWILLVAEKRKARLPFISHPLAINN